jgi:hypothetical protein
MKMNDTPKFYQVTQWADPEDKILSQWGSIRLSAWLALEVKRWNDKKSHAEVRYVDGKAALFGFGVEQPVEADYER